METPENSNILKEIFKLYIINRWCEGTFKWGPEPDINQFADECVSDILKFLAMPHPLNKIDWETEFTKTGELVYTSRYSRTQFALYHKDGLDYYKIAINCEYLAVLSREDIVRLANTLMTYLHGPDGR